MSYKINQMISNYVHNPGMGISRIKVHCESIMSGMVGAQETVHITAVGVEHPHIYCRIAGDHLPACGRSEPCLAVGGAGYATKHPDANNPTDRD